MKTQIGNSEMGTRTNEPRLAVAADASNPKKVGLQGAPKLLTLMLAVLGWMCSPVFSQVTAWDVGAGRWDNQTSWTNAIPNGAMAVARIANVQRRGQARPTQARATLDLSPTVDILTLGKASIAPDNNAQLLMNGGQTLTVGSQAWVYGTIVASRANNVINLGANATLELSGSLAPNDFGGKLKVNTGATLRIRNGHFANYVPPGFFGNGILRDGWYDISGSLTIDDLGPIRTNEARIDLYGGQWAFTDGNVSVLEFLEENGDQNSDGTLIPGVLALHNGAKLKLQAPGATVNQNLHSYGLVRIDAGCELEVGGALFQSKPKGSPLDSRTVVDGKLTLGVGPIAFLGGKPSADFAAGTLGGGGYINGEKITNEARFKPGHFQFPPSKYSADTDTGLAPGQLAQPTRLTITGNYEQLSQGVSEIDMTESLYGQMAVSGTANLSGSLDVDLLDSVIPNGGGLYTILTAQEGLSGYFDNAPPGSRVTVSRNGVDVGSMVVNYDPGPDGSWVVTLSNYQSGSPL